MEELEIQKKQQKQRINEEIKSSEVRVIGETGEQLGIVPIQEALRTANEAELDLVEVAPNSTPPVCRIMNFGKFKYEQQKRSHAQRKKGQSNELKELRLGRSIKVEKHDLEFKLKKAKEMLGQGHRLQVFLQLRGREISHANLGLNLLREFAEGLREVAKLDIPPTIDRRRVNMLLAPLPAPAKAKKKPASPPRQPRRRRRKLPGRPGPMPLRQRQKAAAPSRRRTRSNKAVPGGGFAISSSEL